MTDAPMTAEQITKIPAMIVLLLCCLSGCAQHFEPAQRAQPNPPAATPLFEPHPEALAQRTDYMACISKVKLTPENAYVCHVAVEIREWLTWNGVTVNDFYGPAPQKESLMMRPALAWVGTFTAEYKDGLDPRLLLQFFIRIQQDAVASAAPEAITTIKTLVEICDEFDRVISEEDKAFMSAPFYRPATLMMNYARNLVTAAKDKTP